MSCGQRLCPGVGGRRCGAFMSPIFRDPHPTCVRCRGKKCMADMTFDTCKDWSVAQWEAFLKMLPYSVRRRKRLSGSALPPVPQTPPALRLCFFGSQTPCASPSATPPPLLLRGVTGRGMWRVSFAWVLARSPLPLPPFGGRGEGGHHEGLGFCGQELFGCFLPPRSRGSEIIVLTGVLCAC